MSAATDFLNYWIQVGADHAPSITVASCQPSGDMTPGPRHWSPGIVGYGFGIDGRIKRDSNGIANGLHFGEVLVAYSDRVSNPAASPPDYQRFNTKNKDRMQLDLVIEGDMVRLTVILTTWGNATWTAKTSQTDGGGGQLLFTSVPPAGPVQVRAVMLISFQPSGSFGWL